MPEKLLSREELCSGEADTRATETLAEALMREEALCAELAEPTPPEDRDGDRETAALGVLLGSPVPLGLLVTLAAMLPL